MSTWRWPAPHEVLGFLCAVAFGLDQAAIFAPGSVGQKIVGLAMFLAGMAGTASARNYLSPRVREILATHDTMNGHTKEPGK